MAGLSAGIVQRARTANLGQRVARIVGANGIVRPLDEPITRLGRRVIAEVATHLPVARHVARRMLRQDARLRVP